MKVKIEMPKFGMHPTPRAATEPIVSHSNTMLQGKLKGVLIRGKSDDIRHHIWSKRTESQRIPHGTTKITAAMDS